MDLDRLVDIRFRRTWPSSMNNVPLSEEYIGTIVNKPFYLSILREGWQRHAVSTRANKGIRDIKGAIIEMDNMYDVKSKKYLLAAPIVDARFEDGSSIDETMTSDQDTSDYFFMPREVDLNGPQPILKGELWKYYPEDHTLSAQYEQKLIVTLRHNPRFKIKGPIDSLKLQRNVSLQHPLLMLHRYSAEGRTR